MGLDLNIDLYAEDTSESTVNWLLQGGHKTPNKTTMLRAASTLATLATAAAHSAMTIPEPRNAVDSDQKPWGGKVPHPLPFEP